MGRIARGMIGLAVIGWWSLPALAVTPADKCLGDKLKRAGLFDLCRLKASARALKDGLPPAHDTCDAKLIDKWQAAEARAGGQCPTNGDLGSVRAFIVEHSDALTAALAGGALPSCPVDLSSCQANLDACETNSEQLAAACQQRADQLAACNQDLSTCGASLSSCDADRTACDDALGICTADLAQSDLELATCAADLAACRAGCGDGVVGAGEQCDRNDLGGATCVSQGFAGGTLACDPTTCAFDTAACWNAHFTDQGDGTVIDHHTGLMWEKKVSHDNTVVAGNRHDGDNTYRWAGTCAVGGGDCQPSAAASAACSAGVDGADKGCAVCTPAQGACVVGAPAITTVWKWLVDLNAVAFAGHSDWRMPSRAELQTIVDYADAVPGPAVDTAFRGPFCGASCADLTDPTCSCTAPASYWSATTYAPLMTNAWYVNFYDGFVNVRAKNQEGYLRAVR